MVNLITGKPYAIGKYQCAYKHKNDYGYVFHTDTVDNHPYSDDTNELVFNHSDMRELFAKGTARALYVQQPFELMGINPWQNNITEKVF